MSDVPDKCVHCTKDKVFHDLKVLPDNTVVEKHACEDCAAEQGFVPMQVGVPAKPTAEKASAKARACPECGLTFAQFKRVGRLGCPACYEAFERQLTGILDRSQEGGTHHVGKIPRRLLRERTSGTGDGGESLETLLGDAKHRAERLKALGEKLRKAVEQEQYEQAARIRDQIRTASQLTGGSAADEPGAEA